MPNTQDTIQQQIQKDLSKINFGNYVIELGVIAGDSKERKNISTLGINNAELMFIHENGSPLHNIPARPVLDLTLKWANHYLVPHTLDRCLKGVYEKNWGENEIELELKKMCIRIQNHARNIIYDNDGTLAPNSPAVAKRKKGNHPLFDTGQLARSIVCRLVKV